MKILVAGGAGYVGSVLVPNLIEHGYEVDVIDLLWFGNKLPSEVNVIKKNLFKCKKEDFTNYDQVIFLAGLSNDPMAEFSPSNNFIYNAALPSYLAYIAKEANVKRFIYASSCSVYGYTVDELYDEESPTISSYPYGISKLQGERGVLQLQDENFSVIALRKGTVCGYSPRMRFDLIVNTMFKFAMVENKIIITNPSIWRPILDIRDASNAYMRAVQANYSISGIFNVSSDNFTVGEVGDIVKYEIEKKIQKKIQLEIHNKLDFRNYKVKTDKAKTYLGYHPQHTITDIVENLFDKKEEYGDYEKKEYYNIKIFKDLSGKL
ncbi:MAG: NAD-dependent epimerase/dehydratase family protein [Promethearchaeota archaeon]